MKEDLFGICPYVTSQKVLSGKWSILILHLLDEAKSIRFNELQRMIPEDITHATLSRQLKYLEKESLIIRKDYAEIPPRVEYSLSEIGERFKIVLNELENWGEEYISYIKNNHIDEK